MASRCEDGTVTGVFLGELPNFHFHVLKVSLTSELRSALEDEIHIPAWPCNILLLNEVVYHLKNYGDQGGRYYTLRDLHNSSDDMKT